MTRTLEMTDEDIGYHPSFRPRRHRALILRHGATVTVEREASCPCMKVDGQLGNEDGVLGADTLDGGEVGGEASGPCPDCGGTGSVFLCAATTRALASDNLRKGFRSQDGAGAEGEVKLTFLPEVRPQYLDRVLMHDAFDKFSERAIRKGLVDRFRYPIAPRELVVGAQHDATEPEFDREPVIYLRRVGADGLPTGEPLLAGVDGEVTPDGGWDWTLGDIAGTAPALGQGYSITAWTQARYVLTEAEKAHRPQRTREPDQVSTGAIGPTEMPVRWKAKLEVTGPPPGSTT